MPTPRPRAVLAVTVLATTALGLSLPTAPDAEARQNASVKPRGVTRLMPGIVQPGNRVAAADDARLTGNIQFWPARRGRPVVVQRRLAGQPWSDVAVRRENRAGVVYFVGPSASHGRSYFYRGVARRYHRLAVVRATPAGAAGWSSKFSDEFAGHTLDLDKWDYRALGLTSPHRTRSVSSQDAVQVTGGSLRLSVKRDPTDQTRYLNGHIATQGKFDFTYGVASARIRFERWRGQHGAFWMLPTARQELPGQPAKSGAEIDTVEYFGQGADKGGLGSFVYNYGMLGGDGEPRRLGAVWPAASEQLPRGDAWWRSYHVFTVQWTPSRYVFLVDGRPHWTTRAGVSGMPNVGPCMPSQILYFCKRDSV